MQQDHRGAGGNLGISFSTNSLGLVEDEAGGSGNFAAEPSPLTVAFFLSGGADTMNVAAGFKTGFSFFYSSDSKPGTVTVWSGLNGTGTELASLNLAPNPAQTCNVDPGSGYCNWTPVGVTFAGAAESVNFGGVANYIAFDNVTIGSSMAGTPESGAWILMGIGLLGVGVLFARRRTTDKATTA